MVTASDVTLVALALEGTKASRHFHRTAFKVRRIYATLAADGLSVNLKLNPDEQEMKCLVRPEAFAPVPNKWGKQGWTVATLAALTADDMRSALHAAWAHAGPP
ncbi:MmcQ/YjbR family DNA-binding protein [uncultured Paracoccus sp.]|uniref:MmcQ/YjbR family DNA-binding protein n=1 Tax=uncultured Paracoccus sp. TaxID=189685 RepID=UPI00263270A5|nr:MmcQ/YjbR family DNA-binding protein [uncultured Paracoccus sp.]